MEEYTDVMIDVETTGTNPDRSAILQISGVKFNVRTQAVSPDFFNMSLTMPPHRSWDLDTANWWNRQKKGVLENILKQAQPYREVIHQLAAWAKPFQGLEFWAKPTTFDYMFIASYFHDEGLPNPFSYRTAKDMNSFIAGLYFPEPVPNLHITHEGDAHNALQDCFWQLKVLFAHIKDAQNDS